MASFEARIRYYCQRTSGSITSWGRTPSHNKAVGGVPDSQHLSWTACDVVYDVKQPISIRQAIAKDAQLQLVEENDHDHLQLPHASAW